MKRQKRSSSGIPDSMCFAFGWRFFFFFTVILYVLWWHKPRFGDSWENIWGLVLLFVLAYLCLSFSIQVLLLSGLLLRRELKHSLSLPRVLAPSVVQLHAPGQQAAEFVLEVRLPNILFGIQVFWELCLRDPQTQQKIRLCYRLRSGSNRIRFSAQSLLDMDDLQQGSGVSAALPAQQKGLLSQFRRGLYFGDNQCFFVRDCLSCLYLRYRIWQDIELAVLAPAAAAGGAQSLSANTSQYPLNNTVHKFAQEGFSEQRPYYPGDDPRRINWKLYSRFDELYVRIPEEQQLYSQDLHCYFVPDMSCYPAALRSSVLDQSANYFLFRLKQLHGLGYRIWVHIPVRPSCGHGGNRLGRLARLRNASLALNAEGAGRQRELERGLLYHEQNEEAVFRALTAYPVNCSLASGGANPLPHFLQNLEHSESSGSHLVFVSPHSLGNNIYQDYFPARQCIFIPLLESSAALQKVLTSGSSLRLLSVLPRLVPGSLLWHWLFQSARTPRMAAGSAVHQLYRNLGLPTVAVGSREHGKRGVKLGRDAERFYNLGTDDAASGAVVPVREYSYPALLRLLWAWQRYYREPQRRYSIGRARRH